MDEATRDRLVAICRRWQLAIDFMFEMDEDDDSDGMLDLSCGYTIGLGEAITSISLTFPDVRAELAKDV